MRNLFLLRNYFLRRLQRQIHVVLSIDEAVDKPTILDAAAHGEIGEAESAGSLANSQPFIGMSSHEG